MPLLEKHRPGRRGAQPATKQSIANQPASRQLSAKQPCAGCGPKPVDAPPCQPCVGNLLRAAEQMLDFAAHRRSAAEFLTRAAHEARDRPELQQVILDARVRLEEVHITPNFAALKKAATPILSTSD